MIKRALVSFIVTAGSASKLSRQDPTGGSEFSEWFKAETELLECIRNL
jgi:hypothetical protein